MRDKTDLSYGFQLIPFDSTKPTTFDTTKTISYMLIIEDEKGVLDGVGFVPRTFDSLDQFRRSLKDLYAEHNWKRTFFYKILD